MKKKFFAILLSLCMVITMMPAAVGTAWAEVENWQGAMLFSTTELVNIDSITEMPSGVSSQIKFNSSQVTNGVATGTYFIYLAQVGKNNSSNAGKINAGSLQKLMTNTFDIKYITGDNGQSVEAAAEALTFTRDGDNSNKYTVTLNPSKQTSYDSGCKKFDVWPNSEHEYTVKGEKVTVYNSEICIDANQGGGQGGDQGDQGSDTSYKLVFSERSNLESLNSLPDEESELKIVDLYFNKESASYEGYFYVAEMKKNSNGHWNIKSFGELNGGEVPTPYYLSGYDNNENPIFVWSHESVEGFRKSTSPINLTITKDNSGKYTITYDYTKDEYEKIIKDSDGDIGYNIGLFSSDENNGYVKVKRDEVDVEPLWAGLDCQDPAPVSDDAEYKLSYEMLVDLDEYTDKDGNKLSNNGMSVDGQGEGMQFTDGMADSTTGIAHWYTCFYVTSSLNNYRDARYTQEYFSNGGNEIRTYIGNENSYKIEASHYDSKSESWGDWVEITDQGASDVKDIFKITYIGYKKGFSPVYEITYDLNSDKSTDATSNKTKYKTDEWQFRIIYSGDDRYLNNRNQNTQNYVYLYHALKENDFSFDQYFYENNENWSTGNVQYFDKVGETLITKMIIRPAGSINHEKKILYRSDSFTYITGDPKANFKVRYKTIDQNGDSVWEEMSVSESPFTFTWDETNQWYTIKYDKPEKDLYGPMYVVVYDDENWKDKLTIEKYGNLVSEENKPSLALGDEASVWTNKLTAYVSSLETSEDNQSDRTRYANAWSDGDIDVTEVVLNKGAVNDSLTGDTNIQINTEQGTTVLSGDLVTNIKNANGSDSVSFTVQDVEEETYGLTNAQVAKVEDEDTVAAVDLAITSDSKDVSFGETGEATVVIGVDNNEFQKLESETLTAYYVDDNGNMTKVGTAALNSYPEVGEGGEITFTTTHFSTYIVSTNPNLETKRSSYSGGGAAATTDNVTNTAENKATDTQATTTATVKSETKTDSTGAKTTTATVDSTTANKIVEKAVANESKEVVVDTSSKATVTETAAGAKTEVAIPAETITQISEKTEAEVVIKTDAAEVVLDQKTVETVAETVGTTGEVKLVVETVAQNDSKLEVELKLVSANGNVSDFKGGNVSVTVKIGKTLAAKKLICVYIDDYGTYHKVSGKLNTDSTYTFKTTHFSTYAIMAEEDVDKIIAEQIANVDKMVGDLSLKARSSKTAKGNIKVKVITNADDIKALEDLGYTVKYKFYRSTKKASGYKAKVESAGKTYTNTTGKKGTRYYYKTRMMVYDSEGTLIAKSALTQCKYAVRVR